MPTLFAAPPWGAMMSDPVFHSQKRVMTWTNRPVSSLQPWTGSYDYMLLDMPEMKGGGWSVCAEVKDKNCHFVITLIDRIIIPSSGINRQGGKSLNTRRCNNLFNSMNPFTF